MIVSENDSVGGGGHSAAPVAKKILQAYWDQKDNKGATINKIEPEKEQADAAPDDDESSPAAAPAATPAPETEDAGHDTDE